MKHRLIAISMLGLGIVVGTLGQPLGATAQQVVPYWQEPLPTRSFDILIAQPGQTDPDNWTVLECYQVLSTDPGDPDITTVSAAGRWFIGLDLGAHQAAHKLVCGPPPPLPGA